MQNEDCAEKCGDCFTLLINCQGDNDEYFKEVFASIESEEEVESGVDDEENGGEQEKETQIDPSESSPRDESSSL